MFISLENFRFPIPFKNITEAEQQLIEQIEKCRKIGGRLIGQAKLSDRQTVIILSYLITNLLKQPLQINNSQSSQDIRRDQQILKTVIYLCRSKKRKIELVKMANSVRKFIQKSLASLKETHNFSLENQPQIENNVILHFYEGNPEDEKHHEEMFKLCKQKGFAFRRMYFLTTSTFLDYKLKRKEEIIWKKTVQFGCQNQHKTDHLSFLSKKVDFLMIQSNDIEGVLQQMASFNIFEIHLHRAYLQFRKLNKFYNFRMEQRKSSKIVSLSKINKQQYDPKYKQVDKNQPISLENMDRGNSLEKPESITLRNQQKSKSWNIADYDKKFNELYKQKKQSLMTTKGGYISSSLVSSDYAQCFYLMNLQTIGYLINFLLDEWSKNKFQQNVNTASNFINYIYTTTLLSANYLRKMRRVFLSFIKNHPPKIKDVTLSYIYIDQILTFFQKTVIWNQIFCKPTISIHSLNLTENHHQIENLAARFYVFRQKTNKDSNLKITSFDQRILLEILAESAKGFSILQNLAMSHEYYSEVFQTFKIKKDLQIQYRCPKIAGKYYKHTLNGFIVSSTPNEQDLHIVSEKQEDFNKDLLDQKREDKEHYRQIIRSYGVLVHDICQIVPDGVIIYFPSKDLLRQCRTEWLSEENIYQRINKAKKIFQEDQWEKNNLQNVANFKKYCQIGRGAVYFISAQSQFSKYQTFYGLYSRCIVFVGVPYHPYHLETDQKVKFLKLQSSSQQKKFLKYENFRYQQALKNVSRCLANCLNCVNDVKTVIFADEKYNNKELKQKWFPFIEEGNLNTLQVLDLILSINKSSSNLLKKRLDQEEKLIKQHLQRMREDSEDFIRRHSQGIKDKHPI